MSDPAARVVEALRTLEPDRDLFAPDTTRLAGLFAALS
jgi:hypothetical protein